MVPESTVAGFGLEFVMVATQRLMVAATDGTEQTSMVVEAGLVLVPGPILVVGPDVVVAEPTVAVAGLLAELAVPRGVALGLFAVVASTVVDDEAESVVAAPTGPGAAAAFAFVGLEADPMLVLFAACLAVESVPMMAEHVLAPEGGSMLDEHGLGVVLAPEVDSMKSGFERSMHLSVLGAVFVPEGTDVIPKEAGMGIDLQLLPEAGLDATNAMMAAVVFASVPQPR